LRTITCLPPGRATPKIRSRESKFAAYTLKPKKMDLQQILTNHLLWLSSNGSKGARANFFRANLPNAHFPGGDISTANFSGSNFDSAILTDANLIGYNLSNTNFRAAD